MFKTRYVPLTFTAHQFRWVVPEYARWVSQESTLIKISCHDDEYSKNWLVYVDIKKTWIIS